MLPMAISKTVKSVKKSIACKSFVLSRIRIWCLNSQITKISRWNLMRFYTKKLAGKTTAFPDPFTSVWNLED